MAVACALIAGCAAGQASLRAANSLIRVFGAELGAEGIPPELCGVDATEEPCLKGYERIFETLAVSIGYGHNGRIRKITTRNSETAMFGIHPGDDLRPSRERALAAGFRETGTANRYKDDSCSLMLLVGENGRVFGMTVELLD
jgi:hypothetical protein